MIHRIVPCGTASILAIGDADPMVIADASMPAILKP